jgi:protein TonB
LNGLFEYVEERPRRGDVSLAVLLSVALHLAALTWIATRHYTQPKNESADPVRYVQIVPELSKQFTEAPGPQTDRQPRPDAPLSDQNRKAMTPNPTGPEPTDRPGDATGIYDGGPRGLPPSPPPMQQAVPPVRQQPPAQEVAPDANATAPEAVEQRAEAIQAFREGQETATDAPAVNWQEALRGMQNAEQRPTAPRIGRFDAGGNIGGDLGTAETGPLSFESNWFEWGDYAAKMIARIRVHWYANMPDLIRMGVRGMVTIRFTIQRDGSITDIIILSSSGVPPYDNAAVQALQLSSPLAPLPPNFPLEQERVTARFLYNMTPPRR